MSNYRNDPAEEAALLDSIVETNRHVDRMRKHWDKTVARLNGTCVRGCDDDATEGGLCVRCAKDRFGESA